MLRYRKASLQGPDHKRECPDWRRTETVDSKSARLRDTPGDVARLDRLDEDTDPVRDLEACGAAVLLSRLVIVRVVDRNDCDARTLAERAALDATAIRIPVGTRIPIDQRLGTLRGGTHLVTRLHQQQIADRLDVGVTRLDVVRIPTRPGARRNGPFVVKARKGLAAVVRFQRDLRAGVRDGVVPRIVRLSDRDVDVGVG